MSRKTNFIVFQNHQKMSHKYCNWGIQRCTLKFRVQIGCTRRYKLVAPKGSNQLHPIISGLIGVQNIIDNRIYFNLCLKLQIKTFFGHFLPTLSSVYCMPRKFSMKRRSNETTTTSLKRLDKVKNHRQIGPLSPVSGIEM